jgi:hypothetical protein
MTKLAHTLRDAVQADRRLIGDSWCKTLLGCSDSNPRGVGPLAAMQRSLYFSSQEALIDAILRDSGTKVVVACAPEAPEHVFGWVCASPSERMLHFVYVSWAERRFGVGSSLIRSVFDQVGEKPIVLTHWTRVAPCYFEKWLLKYNPFALYKLV